MCVLRWFRKNLRIRFVFLTNKSFIYFQKLYKTRKQHFYKGYFSESVNDLSFTFIDLMRFKTLSRSRENIKKINLI